MTARAPASQASISGRVMLATIAAAVLAGLSVAVVGLGIDEVLAGIREDARLAEAASTLAAELREPNADPQWVATDETRELAGTGIVVAIFEGDQRIAGDSTLDRPREGPCGDVTAARACEVEAARWIAVAARPSALRHEHRGTFVLALGMAVIVSTLLSALGARLVARWSLTPLVALTDRVASLDPERVSSAHLGPASDVAEVEALRAALARTLDDLATALEHARRFAGHAAHELRTPLTAIAGELELAAESVEEADDVESVSRARRTVDRLSRLVERLLALSRPRGDLARESVDVTEVLEELVAELGVQQRSRVRVPAPPLDAIDADRALLGAMLSAGIENALKFSEGEVDVSVSLGDTRVAIDVDDSGPGVPPEVRDRVFEAFERGPGQRPSTGHGLGLALVRHVATLHGGTARFVDGARGARLRIELPTRKAPS